MMTDTSPAIVSSLNLVDAVTPPPSPSENEEKQELVSTMHNEEEDRGYYSVKKHRHAHQQLFTQ